MKFSFVWPLATIAVCSGISHADVITTFNFNDAIWDVQISETSPGITDPISGVRFGGSTLYADRTGTAGGSVLVTATLNSTISTAGFQNISLAFDNLGTTNLEHNAVSFGSASGDAFEISSTDGVSFSTRQASVSFRNALNVDATWTPAKATPFSQNLTFLSSVDNAQISDFQINLQVDGSNEAIRLSNFVLSGDTLIATVATPEPGSFAVLLLSTLGFAIRLRRRSKPNAIKL